ncbi:MAG: hypothetical protein FWE67_05840 [Planctomycetaceae bacterium]|nr:hypothetical protein [Planctomycetaceae bacterium]
MKRRDFLCSVVKASAAVSGSCAALHLPLFVDAAETAPAPEYRKALSKPLLNVAAQKKNDQPWIDYPTRTAGHLAGYKPKKDRKFNKYGGIPNTKTKKTGFWHVEKHQGRFWFVDPDGGLNIHRAVCTVSSGGAGDIQKKAFAEKFGKKSVWAEETLKLLHENGFNGTGSWSDAAALSLAEFQKAHPKAHTLNLALMGAYGRDRSVAVPGHRGYPNDCIFVFEPEFAKFCDESAAKQTAQYKDDPNFLGYFTDNELPFRMNALEGYLKNENPDDPGRRAAEKWLAQRNRTKEQIEDKDRWEFLGYLGDTYSSITANAIRKCDPNHLVLGPRLYGDNRSRWQLMKGIAKHIDVISFNYYGVWTPQEQHTKGWTQQTGKPFMTTEWYTKGMDSGLPNNTGAGWNVKTQRDRGLFYQNYTLALLECKNCIGWHWFKYLDNDPTAKNAELSNIDSNKGMVSNEYEPYSDLTALMKEINEQVFDLIEYFDAE